LKLIVGLGNPGFRYKATRHNLGFMAIEGLASALDVRLERLECKSQLGRGEVYGKAVVLAKPMTYMNLSGQAVLELVRSLRVELADVWIVCDDLDLPLGRIRLRPKGGDGGHKGLRSIIAALGSEAFPRLRLGIGPRPPLNTAEFVLGEITKEEWPKVQEMLSRAIEALLAALEKGWTAAMNVYNNPSAGGSEGRR